MLKILQGNGRKKLSQTKNEEQKNHPVV